MSNASSVHGVFELRRGSLIADLINNSCRLADVQSAKLAENDVASTSSPQLSFVYLRLLIDLLLDQSDGSSPYWSKGGT